MHRIRHKQMKQHKTGIVSKKSLKKVIATIMAVVLLVCGMGSIEFQITAIAEEGPIKNAEFEKVNEDGSIEGWSANSLEENNGSVIQQSKGGHKGGYVKITTDSSYAIETDKSNLVDVAPSTIYNFSYWVKIDDKSAVVIPYVYQYNKTCGSAEVPYRQIGDCIAEKNEDGWKKISGTITTSSDTEYIGFKFVLMHKDTKKDEISVGIDSVYIEEMKKVLSVKNPKLLASPSSENMLTNGSFETGDFAGWTNTTSSTTTVTKEKAVDGSYSVKMNLKNSSDQGYIHSNQINVVSGETYIVSYELYIKSKGGTGNDAQCYAMWYEFDESGNVVVEKLIDSTGRWVSTGGWEDISYTQTVSEHTKTVRIDFFHNAVVGTSYWDNICMKKYVKPTDNEGNENLLVNGDFSSKLSGWVSESSKNAKLSVEKGALKMSIASGEQGYLEQTIDVKGNHVYRISYKIKTDVKDGDYKWCCISIIQEFRKDGSIKTTPNETKAKKHTKGWESVSYKITTKEDTKQMRLDLMHANMSGSSYWDDVCIVDLGEAPPETKLSKSYNHGDKHSTSNVFPNSGFDNGDDSFWSAGEGIKVYKTVDNGGVLQLSVKGGRYVQNTTPVQLAPKKVYRFSYWIKIENAKNMYFSSYYVQNAGIAGKEVWKDYVDPYDAKTSTKRWKKITKTIITPEAQKGQSTIPYYFGFKTYHTDKCSWQTNQDTCNCKGSGKVYIDDISLVAIKDYKVPVISKKYDHGGTKETKNKKNLVKNSMFDNGSSQGWVLSEEAVCYKTTNKGGVVKFNAKGGQYFQTEKTITLKPETTYELSYWVKVSGASNLSFTSFITGGGIEWKDFLPFDITENTNGWKKVTNRFSTPAKNGKKFEPLTIGFKSHYNGNATIYLDDVSLIPIGKYKDAGDGKVSKDSVIMNGTFDRYSADKYSADYWNLNKEWKENGSSAEIQTSVSKSGQSVKINGKGHFYIWANDFNVKPGSIYILSYWVNVTQANNLKFAAYMNDANNGGKWWINDATEPVYDKTNGWVKITSAVTIPDSVGKNSKNPNNLVQLGLQIYEGSGVIYIDDVSMVPVNIDVNNSNLDFELNTNILYNWSLESYNGGKGTMRASSDLRPGGHGNTCAMINNKGADGETIFVSKQQKVRPNTTYEFSYWTKQTGSYSATSALAFRQSKADQISEAMSVTYDAKTENYQGKSAVISPYWTYQVQGEVGWRQVRMSITTGPETEYVDFRFIVLGENTTTYIDDVSLKEATKDINFDFETVSASSLAPQNWYMSMARNQEVEFKTDSSVYHSGSKSLYIKKDSLLEKTLVESSACFEVDSNNVYEWSAWITARNASPDCVIRMNLYLYDKNGNRLYQSDGNYQFIQGTTSQLNSGDDIGQWKKIITRSAPSEDAKYASVSFTITRGYAEIWIDDLFCDVVENDKDCVVDYSDFHAVDSEGNIAEWELEKESGKAEFTASSEGGKLKIDSGEAYIHNNMKCLMTDYTYTLKVKYKSDVDAKLQVRFYNYLGKEYKESRQEAPISSTGNTASLNFTAPSATWARIYIGGEQQGTIQVKNTTVYMVAKPADSSNWDGKWVWYQENPVKEAVKQYRYFRYEFTLEDNVEEAPFQLTVDDKYGLYVNGKLVDENWDAGSDSWANVASYDLKKYVHKGRNIIAIKAYNLVSEAGVLFDGKFTLKNKSVAVVASSSDVLSIKSVNDKNTEWTKLGYNDSGWKKTQEYGQPPCSPWGPVFYNSSLYIHNEAEVVDVEVPEKVRSGNELEFTMTLKLNNSIESKFSPMVTIYKRNSISTITKTPMTFVDHENPLEWPVGKEFKVKCKVGIPDYVETGTYTLQMDQSTFLLNGDNVIDNKFLDFNVRANSASEGKVQSSIENYNGTPTLMINGEPQSAIFYLRPDLNVYLQTDAETRMYKSDLDLYITYGGSLYKGGCDPIWLEDGSIDYDAFDAPIYDALGSNSNSMVMVNIGMFAPPWWMEKHPDDVCQAYDGKSYIKMDDVSLSSETFRKEAGKVLRKLIRHMKKQRYYSRVYGLKITGGQTYEWFCWGTGPNQGPDYSKVSQEGFKNYLKKKYKTVDELQKAWGDSTVTFENATAPGWLERGASPNVYMGSVTEGKLSRNMVDWNLWLNDASADSFLYYSKIAKEETDNQLIVGGYNGYLWTSNSYDSQGMAHTSMERVLDSEYVDWISSPVAYNERLLGESDTYMALIDSVQEHGKMYIAEQDNRTCLSNVYAGASWDASWDFQVGQTRTLADTIYQEKRDYANAMINGNGLWLYDMYGGWLDDDQIYDFISDARSEYDVSVCLDRNQRSDVAVFVGDETYAYMTADTTYNMGYTLFEPMLMQQRKQLSAIGTGYDTYAMSSLLDNKVSDHKINIVLSPYEITDEMQEAIDRKLKKNNQYVIWVYLPGISKGSSFSLENVERTTGFKIGVEERKAGLQVQITDSSNPLTAGMEGMVYGNSTPKSVSPLVYIEDTSEATVLGKNMDGGKTGLAMKDMGDWTSIYSTAPCIDAQMIRNLLKMAGCHIYSNNKEDVIYANNHYVGVHSGEAGKKTIYLPKKYSVYDVFEKKFVSMDTDKIVYNADANDTHIFRLMTPNTFAVTARLKSGQGSLSHAGLTEVEEGQPYELTVKADDGYELASVKVNGEEVKLQDNKFTVENVNDNYDIEVKFNKLVKLVPTTITVEKVYWMPAWLFWIIFIVAVSGIVVAVRTVKKRRKEYGKQKEE